MFDDVMDGDEGLDGDGCIVGCLKAVHEGFDDGGGRGPRAMAEAEERGQAFRIGRRGRVVSCGS